jgi:hypothetical protein
MIKLSTRLAGAVASVLLAACFAATPSRAIPQQAAAQQPTENQDAKDIKAFVIDQAKFEQIKASFGDIFACRKQNPAPWTQLTGDPAYTDASLSERITASIRAITSSRSMC